VGEKRGAGPEAPTGIPPLSSFDSDKERVTRAIHPVFVMSVLLPKGRRPSKGREENLARKEEKNDPTIRDKLIQKAMSQRAVQRRKRPKARQERHRGKK